VPTVLIVRSDSYMGWVQQTMGKEREVFRVIVAKSISENLRYAASIVPRVHLFEYEVEFHLKVESTISSTSRS
jgi:endonuclease